MDATGSSLSDHTLAELVRRSEKPVLVLVNKCEKETNAFEAAALGLASTNPLGFLPSKASALRIFIPF